jgi:ketosteroid isomerase-like protein
MSGRTAIVQEVVAAINRGDWDAALERTSQEFEYDITRTPSPLAGVYPRERMREIADEFLGSWRSARYEAHELVEHGDDVVMPFTTHFEGRDGINVEVTAVWLWSFRGDEVERLTLFQERADALAATGRTA